MEKSVGKTEKKIILVDDSKTARRHIRQILAGAGFEVIEARDGEEGWTAIAANADAAVALVDVHMPGQDGVALVEALQASGRLPGLRVMMLTTETDPSLLQKAKRVGARAWMAKPFRPSMLLAAVRKLAGTP